MVNSFCPRPLVSASTPIRVVDVTDLRTVIDALRVKYGLLLFSSTDPILKEVRKAPK